MEVGLGLGRQGRAAYRLRPTELQFCTHCEEEEDEEEKEREEAAEVLGSKMQWIVKFSIVFQCNSVKRNAADADRWIAAVSQPHDSRVREIARMSERAGGGQLSHSSSKKRHFYCISLIFCEATFAVDSFVGTICRRHTHRHRHTLTQQLTALSSSHSPFSTRPRLLAAQAFFPPITSAFLTLKCWKFSAQLPSALCTY